MLFLMTIVFWTTFFLVVIHYFLFPIAIFALASRLGRRTRAADFTPSISLVIAAYNEEAVIEAKLGNVRELDYPREHLEVIVVSDGSTDSTPHLVEKHEGVLSLFSPERHGKTDALNRAAKFAAGEILVFSDANTFYRPDALRKLARHFADPDVGGVSGCKRLLPLEERESSRGDSTYWDFESRLKEKESLLGSVSTADGEIFALRRLLYQPLPPAMINDDMAITMNVVLAGHRVVYEPQAISEEAASRQLEEDYRVKARMVAGGYQVLSKYGYRLLERPGFALQLFAHKGLRYFMPFLLGGLFLSSFALREEWFYRVAFLGQLAFYSVAALGAALRSSRPLPKFLYYPLYYVVMNLAAAAGLFSYARGESVTKVWKKATR